MGDLQRDTSLRTGQQPRVVDFLIIVDDSQTEKSYLASEAGGSRFCCRLLR